MYIQHINTSYVIYDDVFRKRQGSSGSNLKHPSLSHMTVVPWLTAEVAVERKTRIHIHTLARAHTHTHTLSHSLAHGIYTENKQAGGRENPRRPYPRPFEYFTEPNARHDPSSVPQWREQQRHHSGQQRHQHHSLQKEHSARRARLQVHHCYYHPPAALQRNLRFKRPTIHAFSPKYQDYTSQSMRSQCTRSGNPELPL